MLIKLEDEHDAGHGIEMSRREEMDSALFRWNTGEGEDGPEDVEVLERFDLHLSWLRTCPLGWE